jgi:serine/threonine-protein kinase
MMAPGVTPPDAMTDVVPPVIAVAPLAPGVIIAGRYRLEVRLGAGGGGTVWRCHDDKLGGIVALKIASAHGDLERWRREVAIARRIAHRNVCRVHDLGESDDLRYVTMELIEGTSLRTRIHGELPAAAARDLFSQIVAGAAAIHAAGVVHRDLKPDNIVVDGEGRVVIVDFGIAREPSLATVTGAGAVVGTPRYMAPEQASGQAVDARADVWALGLIGHELLTGALPLPDERGRCIDPAVEARWRGIAGVLRRCLAVAPGERFADARAVQDAMARTGRRRVARRAVLATAALAAAASATAGVWWTQRGAVRDAADAAVTPPAMTQLTAEPKKWATDGLISVALAPDATQFAYTSAGGKLWVRPLAGGTPAAWSIAAFEKLRSRSSGATTTESTVVTLWAIGWFSDGSIAVVGTTRDGDHHLDRVYPDGRSQELFHQAQRFAAATTPVGDRIVVGLSDSAVFVAPAVEGGAHTPVAAIETGEHVRALAWSPDGTRIACARGPGDDGDVAIEVRPAAGGDAQVVWRGPFATTLGALLVWLDDHRLAFASNDLVADRARLYAIDLRGGGAVLRGEWPATYLGSGSAARGTLLVMRGAASEAVQLGDYRGEKLARLHGGSVRARGVAGWTTDERVVFVVGEPGKQRIVRAAAGQALQAWPGTRDGVDLPDTVAGDDLITHRRDDDGTHVVVERISPAGARSEILRLPAAAAGSTVVRCAGDRAPPCIVEEIDGSVVRWTELDPRTGARGPQVHQRAIRDHVARSAALSFDGQRFAVVDGDRTATIVDRKTGEVVARSAGDGVALQSIGFAPDGDVWATAIGFKGQLFGLAMFYRLKDGGIASSPSSRGSWWNDALRAFSRPVFSSDGKQLAIATRELDLEVWRADGL